MEHARARVLPPERQRGDGDFPGGGQDESAIERITAARREELETEIAGLKAEAEQVAEEARELVGDVPF